MAIAKDSSLAVGDVYAEALFEAARQQNQLDEVFDQLTELGAYMEREPEFGAFMIALTVDDDAREAVLDKLFRGRMNDLLLNALQVLNRRRRPDLLPALCEQFRKRMETHRNQIEVDVRTARPLPDDQRNELAGALRNRIGKEPILKIKVDESLLGGLIVQVGDKQLDMSISSRLAAMRQKLLARVSTEIHSGRHFFSE